MAKTQVFLLSTLVLFGMAISMVQAQSVEKGVIIIDPYYGYSKSGKDFATWIAKNQETDLSVLGPLGGRVEYMIANRLGVGLIFNYNTADVKWQASNSSGTEVDSTATMILTNMMVNVNIHLAASSDVLDLYVGLATGTATRTGVRSADVSGAVDVDIDFSDYKSSLGIRLTLGGRYFFTDYLGVNAELGIGSGPIISAGGSVKF